MVARSYIPPWASARAGLMTRLEEDYARQLENRRLAGEIVAWNFESIKLRLATRTWYTPDFMVVFRDRIELQEVKGFWRDDARVKWKTAAELFPCFRFVAVTRKKGEWKYEYYDS